MDLQTRLLDLFLALGATWVLYLLLGLSVVSVAIALERCWFFWRSRENVAHLRLRLTEVMAPEPDWDAARALLSGRPSMEARLALATLSARDQGHEALEETLRAHTQWERLAAERGLAFLGTLGNNAPFLGLFGTVLGIIRAFRDLSLNTAEGSTAVLAGIAEALIATGVGLLVALPAVMVFNLFQRTLRARLTAGDALARSVLARVKAEARRAA